jgi:LysR family transcriptional regulator, glycine cleavage system transcriptional activator
MTMRLPPLNSLRAFEAAARLGGFAVAAEELNVTPAAISHQVKSLEGHLDVQLFHRMARGLALTNAGQELLPNISRGLGHFARAVGALSGGELAGPLVISAVPSFATFWLVPRLRSFMQAFPDINIRILADGPEPDLNLGNVDIRISIGKAVYPGLRTRTLMRDTVFPVCAPSLLNQKPLRRFSDIRHHVLLHDIDVGPGATLMSWARWFRDARLADSETAGNIDFNDAILLTEAAVRGHGIALARQSLVRDYLESGRLVRPLNISQTADDDFYAATTEAGAERPRARVFLDWLERQAEDKAADGYAA